MINSEDCVISVVRLCANTNHGHEGGVTQADRTIAGTALYASEGLVCGNLTASLFHASPLSHPIRKQFMLK